jgi:hypothetical protein
VQALAPVAARPSQPRGNAHIPALVNRLARIRSHGHPRPQATGEHCQACDGGDPAHAATVGRRRRPPHPTLVGSRRTKVGSPLPYGFVVDSVNVNVVEYDPVRSGSFAPMCCENATVTGSLEIGPVHAALERFTCTGSFSEKAPLVR